MTGNQICPLCGDGLRYKVGSQIVPAIGDIQSTQALPHHTIDYFACPHCGTVSQVPLPSAKALDHYYAATPPARHVPGAVAYKKPVYDDRLDLLRRVTGLNHGRCLEVGCGNGILLEMIASRWQLETIGLEPSGTYDTQDVTAGIRIIHGTLAQLDSTGEVEPGSCDLVICRHVLEHVPDPALFLDRLVGMVAPGGWLMIEVPSSLLLARSRNHHSGMNIHAAHLHHFTGSGLVAALAERGLGAVHLSDRTVGGYPCLCLIAQSEIAAGESFTEQLAHQQSTSQQAADHLASFAENNNSPLSGVLIWGAGADLLTVLALMTAEQRSRLLIYDGNPAKQGHTLLDVVIMSTNELAAIDPHLILAGVSNRTLLEDIQDAAATRFPGVRCRSLFQLEE